MLLRPRQKLSSSDLRRGALALLAALLAHVVMGALVVLSAALGPAARERPRGAREASKAVVLRGLTTEQWTRNRSPAPREVRDERQVINRPKDEPKKPDTKPEATPEGQVVAVPKGNQQVDPDAKFIAETNNTVQRQTRAREQTAFYRNAASQRVAPRQVDGNGLDVADRAQREGTLGVGDDDRPLRHAQPKRALEVPDTRRREAVTLRPSDAEGPGLAVNNRAERLEIKGNSTRLKLEPGAGEEGEESSAGRAGQPGVLTLLPSPAVVDTIIGAAANDHLDELEEADGTFLNTREWKYASFFNRVKQTIGQQWRPVLELRQRDPTGNVYGGRDRYTILSVTLDEQGRLKDAWVQKSSGLDFLDLEAVKAFERAQPFPHPPPGILAADQTVRFQFGFFLELTGRPGLRLFRSTQ